MHTTTTTTQQHRPTMKCTPIKKRKQDGNKDAKSIAGQEGKKTQKCTTSIKDPPVAGTNSTDNADNPQASGTNSTNGTSSCAACTNSTNNANDPEASGANSTMAPSTQTWQTLTIMTTVLILKRWSMHHPMHNKQPSPKELPTVTKAMLSNQILNTQTMVHPVKKMTRM
jgi:hypothetical protein